MKAVNRSALKLIVILTLVCLYSFVSFADSGKPASPPPASDSTTPAHGELTDAAPQATAPCDPTAANPVRNYAEINKEDPAFVRFVNPGDLRVAAMSCGTSECHTREVHNVGKSMMTTGAMLWGAALYNNGGYPFKNYRWGESFSPDGKPQRI